MCLMELARNTLGTILEISVLFCAFMCYLYIKRGGEKKQRGPPCLLYIRGNTEDVTINPFGSTGTSYCE